MTIARITKIAEVGKGPDLVSFGEYIAFLKITVAKLCEPSCVLA
jgi:hypothetical protein